MFLQQAALGSVASQSKRFHSYPHRPHKVGATHRRSTKIPFSWQQRILPQSGKNKTKPTKITEGKKQYKPNTDGSAVPSWVSVHLCTNSQLHEQVLTAVYRVAFGKFTVVWFGYFFFNQFLKSNCGQIYPYVLLSILI